MLNERRNAPRSRSPLTLEIEIWDGEQCKKSLHNNPVIRQGYVSRCMVERSLPLWVRKLLTLIIALHSMKH
jgi:hypothetical protein